MKDPRQVGTLGFGNATVLCLDPDDADNESLARIFRDAGWSQHTNLDWTLITRSEISLAVSVLQQVCVPVVICEADRSPGTWQQLLDYLSVLPNPPLLIVTSRVADERLWAECLNVGAYDVLAKPFVTSEVIRILSSAFLHWLDAQRIPPNTRCGEVGEEECTWKQLSLQMTN
jgi:CheY-like chemotaxis protein